MTKIIMLNEELGSQMQIYLALCDGYKIEIADNVESVMYLLRTVKPEILLLDYHLDCFKSNGKTGIDFIKKIKKKYHHLKVMTILDRKDKPLESEIQQNGADGVIYKPIKNRNLITNLKKLTTLAV
ncbi:MAG: response regulator [bacterium]